MGLSKAVVKNRVLILMIALILLVPAVFGMLGTRINYDMLDYLPGDMDTVIGQETLKEDFGKGAFSFIVVQDMPVQEVAQLKEKDPAGGPCGERAVVRFRGGPLHPHGAAAG